jgi:glyoxylase-like metal-dependent hydrolase (beta-lactamase superfamily II)
MPRLLDEFTIGSLRVAALSDGAPEREIGGFFHGVDPDAWTAAVGIGNASTPVPFNFGSFLVRDGQQTVLIDTGYGIPALTMGIPGGGGLLDRLDELGVGRDEVDAVVHTHLHGDHVGWNVQEDDSLTFPNATVHVAAVELDFWLNSPDAPEDRAAVARRNVLPYQVAGRIRTFTGEAEITPGVTSVPTPGHTPGHTAIMLTSAGEHLLIAGDAAHHPVHFEHHDWIPGIDLDPAESTRSRGRLSALAVERDALVTGGHFPILTLGKIRRTADGYAWEYVRRADS